MFFYFSGLILNYVRNYRGNRQHYQFPGQKKIAADFPQGPDVSYDIKYITEALQDSVDLLPEVAIGRFPVETTEELSILVNKTIQYQKNPVMADMNNIVMLGELLLDTPLTMGQDYLDLLVDNHSDNGYTTVGIPSALNSIDTLYDQWDAVGSYTSYE